jgi:tRNA A22 N-methylase
VARVRVLTVGAYNHIDKIKEEIDKRLCNMSPCVLKPNCVVYKKGFIEFLQYEIEDEVLVQNYEFFFSDTIKLYASDAIVEFIMAYTRFYIVRKIVEEQCAEYLKDEQDQIVEMVRTFFYHPENDVDGSLPN